MNPQKPSRLKTVVKLFFVLARIGLLTFGGGYAMIALLEAEFVTGRHWLERDEFLDMTAIAESTPGPIAINCATYLGYRMAGLPGAAAATFGVVLPSFVILFVISLFFDRFLAFAPVAKAFRGIQVCVIYLILSAGIRLFRGLKKEPFAMTVLALTLVGMLTLSFLAVRFSTVFFILASGLLGIAAWGVRTLRTHAAPPAGKGDDRP